MSTHVHDDAATTAVGHHVDHADPGVDVLDGVHHRDPHHHGPRGGVVGSVWRFLTSMRTGLWIILVLGLLTLAGTLLMQATPEALADPAAYKAWYDSGPRLRYGGWAPVLSTLGLFGVFSTWYFRALFALLALSILACSINRAPRLWRVATHPRTSMSETFFTHAPLRAAFDLDADAATAADRVRSGLRSGHYRVLDGTASEGADLYGDRFRWAPFGTVIAHISFVVILAGFVVSATTGFKDNTVIAPIGVPVEVGHGTGLVVTAASFNDSYYDHGAPKDYVSDLILTRDGTQVARHDTRVNDPLRYEGVWFHQASFGIGADIVATRGGQEIFKQTVPLQWQSSDGRQSIGQFAIPAAGVQAYVIEAASGQVLSDLPAGSLALEVHRDGVANPDVKVITQGQSADIGGVTYTFVRNRQYTGLTISRDPGSWVVWVGSVLLILGSILVFFLPYRRVWARVRPNGDGTSHVMIAAPLKRDPGYEPVFADLVHAIADPDVSSHS